MTIENKLTYLAGTKEAIRTAIQNKGVAVSEEDTFREYAARIGEIEGGSPPVGVGVFPPLSACRVRIEWETVFTSSFNAREVLLGYGDPTTAQEFLSDWAYNINSMFGNPGWARDQSLEASWASSGSNNGQPRLALGGYGSSSSWAIPSGSDSAWIAYLFPAEMPPATSFCFRMHNLISNNRGAINKFGIDYWDIELNDWVEDWEITTTPDWGGGERRVFYKP